MEGINMNAVTTEAERAAAEKKAKENRVSLGSVMTAGEQASGMKVEATRSTEIPKDVADRNAAEYANMQKQAERAKRNRMENNEVNEGPESKALVEQFGLDTEEKMKAMKDITAKVGKTLLMKPPEWRKKYAEKSVGMAVKGVEAVSEGYDELDESEEFIMKIIQSDKEMMGKTTEALGEDGDTEDFIKKAIRVQRDTRLNMEL